MTTQIAISPLTLSDADAVDDLMKRNSQTLGFLPRKALDEYIRQRTAIGAKAPSGQLAGYLLYAANPVRFRVVHLCVDNAFHGQRIARHLVDALRAAATTQTGIRLHCRRDYPANAMWPVLDFLPLGERPARTPGRSLTLWYLDLTPEDRLGLFRAKTSDETVDIVVDSQVFFDLHEPDNDTTKVSKSLQSDFMADSVRILLTDEIYLEVDRNRDPKQREISRQHARGFPTVEYDPRSVDHFAAALSKILPGRTRSQKSDIRHLAKTAASQVRTFVTRDEKLLKESAKISTLTGLEIVPPADVIIQHHKLLERQSYGPSRVAGVDFAWRRWTHDHFSSFPYDLFLNDGERKGNFKTKLNRCLADPKLSTVEILYRENDAIAVRVLTRDSNHELIARMVRIARTVDQRQFARFVATDMLARAVEEELCMVRVDSNTMTSGLSHALLETGFTKCGDDFVKFTFSARLDRRTTLHRIGELSPSSVDTYRDLTDLDMEGHCSPLSLRETDQTYFVVPVRPAYAMSLVDRHQSEGDLFGGKAEVLLGWQNVYYRKKTQHRMIKPPGRILWYVSEPEKQIVAVSRLDDVAVDTPKVLFRKFQKFGILKWADLYEMCEGDVTTEIMALLFSHTFSFREPISLATMREIFSKSGVGLTLQSPRRMPANLFEEIFRHGFPRLA